VGEEPKPRPTFEPGGGVPIGLLEQARCLLDRVNALLSNGQAYCMIVICRPFIRLSSSVMDVLWLSVIGPRGKVF